MTDTKEQDAKKRLGLAPKGKLELRAHETGHVRQSFSHGRSKTVQVEVKKKRVFSTTPGLAEPKPQAATAPERATSAPPTIQQTPSMKRPQVLRALTDEERAARTRALTDARRADTEARRRDESEAMRRAEEERRQAEEDRRVREESERKQLEEAASKKAEEDARRKTEEETKKQAAEEEAKRRKAAEESGRSAAARAR